MDASSVSALQVVRRFVVVTALAGALACMPTPGFAAPILSADLASFAVLAAAGVTNVPTSTIGGNLGSAPNPSIGGGYVFSFGGPQSNTPLAQQAQIDLDAAILAVNSLGPGTTVLGGDLDAFQALNGGAINPGVYTVPAAVANLTGALVLDGLGSSSAVWAFLFPSTLITSTTSTVSVTNVGDGANVGLYWSVGTGATLNGPTFAGNVLATTLISSDGNLTMACGRLLSSESQVTLIQDSISIGCEGNGSNGYDQGGGNGGNGGNGNGGNGGNGTVPEPATSILTMLGFGLVGAAKLKSRRIGSDRRTC